MTKRLKWAIFGLVLVATALSIAAWVVWVAFVGDVEARLSALIGVVVLAVATFLALDGGRGIKLGFCFAVYSAAVAVSAGMLWTELVSPVSEVGAERFLSVLPSFSVVALGAMFGPIVGLLIVGGLWCDAAGALVKSLRGESGRKYAKSDLHGKARLLGREHMKKLTRRSGIVLGQWGAGRSAPLICWNLEGSAISVAPPRSGKGGEIALNLLAPAGRGWPGSTVLVDPRGETFCIVARRRREMGRRVILLDPFGVVAGHAEQYGGEPDGVHLPVTVSARYNPLDFIREDDELAVRDINVLLDALLTPPGPRAAGNEKHFYQSARSIIGGYMAWVRFKQPPGRRNLEEVHRLLSLTGEERAEQANLIASTQRFAGGLSRTGVEQQLQVGTDEGGSQFTTIANQFAFLSFPELAASMRSSDFDPLQLAAGDTDLFVVVPEDLIDHVKAWLRLWITIPNAVSLQRRLERDMLIIIDEMPRLGLLEPVMDAFNLAAGRGVHFWGFAQSLSGLDDTWGAEHRRTLVHLAEVVQVLGLPRTDPDGAAELSQAIGTATFENRSESHSGTSSGSGMFDAASKSQVGDNVSVVRERLVLPDELMTLGPDRQFVIASPKDMPRDALKLNHARYWLRRDGKRLADPNPLVLRKMSAARFGRFGMFGDSAIVAPENSDSASMPGVAVSSRLVGSSLLCVKRMAKRLRFGAIAGRSSASGNIAVPPEA